MHSHFSSQSTAGTQATSENAGGNQEFFGHSDAAEYSPHFTVNERPILAIGWNMGDTGVITLQRVRASNNKVTHAADLVLNGGNMCLEADNNVMFICTPGTYRFRVEGVPPADVLVQYTTAQMPHQDYVPAMLQAVSNPTIKERLDELEDRVSKNETAIEAIDGLEDALIVGGSYQAGSDKVILTQAGGETIEIDMDLISSDADNIIEKGSDDLLYASPHRWLAAPLAP